ncbi:xylan 1,4-beta-xylosidase [Streptomyces sp. RB6PN25]|uniref:Xylan 1,4-beta-xylosidase n=1 Tax=Streptomyces humicola TaxID=2953240 RepID=A0ABT1Q1U5_9ACTN|nr:xylan 1,4-beta-xylosidase [Streptomyces humicola]MCQ4083275.1 xylan 1,4-beta-xylosidase [Streptomyces humicola]
MVALCGAPQPRTTGRQPTAQLGWGFTHTQYSADQGSAADRNTALATLSAQPLPQDQAIMGWGTDNPEPAAGRYDFTTLDSRIALIRRTGGTPVITLCCAPDWMKGGRPGTTDWSTLETAPTPGHYADFAALAATVARRYPFVRHFIVWNEFKGFWSDTAGRWDYEGYTRLYNLVYRALKHVDPQIMVGGPYLDMDSLAPGDDSNASAVGGPWGSLDQRTVDALDYWLRNKAGADFLVVDGSSTGSDNRLSPDAFTATTKFSAVSRWLRRISGLPVWWAEWYVEPEGVQWPDDELLAVQAAAMMEIAKGGSSAAFYWNPETESGSCPGCLWRSTAAGAPGGGTGLPMLQLLQRFASAFPPGTPLRAVTVDTPAVRVLGDARAVLAVNTTARTVRARVDGHRVDLGPYAVVWTTSMPLMTPTTP